jgi:hypothetical protein
MQLDDNKVFDCSRLTHQSFLPSFILKMLTSSNHDDFDSWDLSYRELGGLHKKAEFAFFDIYTAALNPPLGYLEFLEYFGYPREWGKADLVEFKEYVDVEGNGVLYPAVAAGKLNPWRFWGVSRASVSRLVNKILQLRDLRVEAWCSGGVIWRRGIDYVWGLDLTFPSLFSELAFKDPEGIVKIAKKCLKSFIERLEKYFGGKLGLFANLHLWSSEVPWIPHLHWHLNILNAIFVKKGVKKISVKERRIKKEKNSIWARSEPPLIVEEKRVVKRMPEGVLYRFSPWLDEDDGLVALRRLWRDVLIENGVDEACGVSLNEVDVYSGFIEISEEAAAELVHRFKYCGRSPLVDFFAWYEDHSFEPSDIQKTFCGFLVEYKNRREVYGWARWLSSMVPIPEQKTKRCPVCGKPARVVRRVSVGEVAERISEGLPVVYWDHKNKCYTVVRWAVHYRI